MRFLVLAISFALSLTSVAAAQEAPPAQKQTDGVSAPPPQSVNADELGVSIDRIRLRFTRAPMFGNNVFDPSRMRLTTYVDVVAKAPPIRLFGPNAKQELTSRAVPFGAPTHQDMLQIMTPQEFRTPPMDLTALMNWIARQLNKDKGDE